MDSLEKTNSNLINYFMEGILDGDFTAFDLPEDLVKNITLARLLRERCLRVTKNCGYDCIWKKFFVKEIWVKSLDVEQEKTILFDSFAEFYNYLDGEIYQNSCFFQFPFSDDDINTFNIRVSDLNTTALISETIEDTSFDTLLAHQQEKELERKTELVREQRRIKTWKTKFRSCSSVAELTKTYTRYSNLDSAPLDSSFFLSDVLAENPTLGYEFLLENISKNGRFASDTIRLFGKENILEAYNLSKKEQSNTTFYKNRKNIVAFMDTYSSPNWVSYDEYKAHSKEEQTALGKNCTLFGCPFGDGGYSDSAQLYYINPSICLVNNNKIVETTFARKLMYLYNDFESFTEGLKGDLANMNLSAAPYDSCKDWSVYKTNRYTILPKKPVTDVVVASIKTEKQFSRKSNRFTVTRSWLNRAEEVIETKSWTFHHFFDFAFFLNYDFSEADLSELDCLDNVQIDECYNLSGIKLQSSAAAKFGLEVKAVTLAASKSFATIEQNEMSSLEVYRKENYPQVDRDISLYDLGLERIYYISDLHLNHYIINMGCLTQTDIDQALESICEKLGDAFFGTLLIAGDTSDSFDLFKRFVDILSKQTSSIHVIFVLGNHEVWDESFLGMSYSEVISEYRNVIESYPGMYLLENSLLVFDRWRQNPVILNEDELLSISTDDLRAHLVSAARIIFGGMGFSGLNKEFNADNDVYGTIIDRTEECYRSENFSALHDKIASAMPNREVIILSHMPVQDWLPGNPHSGFIYVSGHTHNNYMFDDGSNRIYANNQVGYHSTDIQLKYILCATKYDIFEFYEDGIYEISADQYKDFYNGKHIRMDFTRNVKKIYMLKRSGYYLFIQEGYQNSLASHLYIMNGAAVCRLEYDDINYYYKNMDRVLAYLNKPIMKFAELQETVATAIQSVGGSGRIHGCIVDIDFYNHLYVNPLDLKVTPYWAENIINKIVYTDVVELLEERCPLLYAKYLSLLEGNDSCNPIAVINTNTRDGDCKKTEYLQTDIYSMSRQISKLQRLKDNILTVWKLPKTSRIK